MLRSTRAFSRRLYPSEVLATRTSVMCGTRCRSPSRDVGLPDEMSVSQMRCRSPRRDARACNGRQRARLAPLACALALLEYTSTDEEQSFRRGQEQIRSSPLPHLPGSHNISCLVLPRTRVDGPIYPRRGERQPRRRPSAVARACLEGPCTQGSERVMSDERGGKLEQLIGDGGSTSDYLAPCWAKLS